jgi:hypothetical protein
VKPDAPEILAVLDELCHASWLGRGRANWPNNLYHFADVRNAANILLAGAIHCRTHAVESGLLLVDSADQEVIADSTWAHGFARLYFGPRTPTQYHMEGIRPVAGRRHGAHCPIPVFFVFDSRSLLVRDDCQFSNGNVASPYHQIGSDAAFFRQLPFRDIYHRGVYTARGPEITYARNAEVLFERTLDLSSLRAVVCRTGPERETLLGLLGRDQARVWKSRIRLEAADEGLFERRWYFVRDISLHGEIIHVQMSPGSERQPQHLEYIQPGGQRGTLQPTVTGMGRVTYHLPEPADSVAVKLTLIDSMAYRGKLTRRTLFEPTGS